MTPIDIATCKRLVQLIADLAAHRNSKVFGECIGILGELDVLKPTEPTLELACAGEGVSVAALPTESGEHRTTGHAIGDEVEVDVGGHKMNGTVALIDALGIDLGDKIGLLAFAPSAVRTAP